MWWDAMRSPAARWNHPKAVEKTVPWKPWKTKPTFPTAPTAPWKTRNLGEFPTFPPPCDSLFPSLKKAKGQEGSMKQADRSSVNKSGQIQKLPTVLPKASARDKALQGFVGRCKNPGARPQYAGSPKAAVFAVLKHVEQLGLKDRVHFANF